MSLEASREWSGHDINAIQLLKQLQVDCRLAKNELQEVSWRFSEREAMASKQLQIAFEALDKAVAAGDGSSNIASRQESQVPSLASEDAGPVPNLQLSRPSLEVYCLGRFQVRVGWKRIEHWRSNKAKSLLKYLIATQGQTATKDALMEALWPGCEPSLANNNLKATVRSLRQTLSLAHGLDNYFAWVLFLDGSYSMNLEADLWVDLEQFEYHWRAGRELERDGKVIEATGEYKTAEALYKGDYLEDDLYEEWTSLRREALKDVYLAMLGKLAEHSMQMTDYQACIAYCQRILAKDQCREDAYRQLMRCYSQLGQRNRAIGWYRVCESTIKNELDVCPDRHTIGLYQKLLNDEDI